MARIAKLGILALALVLLGACKNDGKKNDEPTSPTGTVQDDDTVDAEDGADANNAETDTQLLASSLVSSTATSTLGLASVSPGDLATDDLGGSIHALYLPRACATAVQSGTNEATYTFMNCLGPNGLLGVSGQVIIGYTSTATSLHLDMTLTDVKLNGAEIKDGHATADITASGAKRTMTWADNIVNATTANGKKFAQTSQHTVSWTVGERCFALDGVADSQIRQREIKTEIKDFERCGRGCPEAGGEIIVTNVAKNRSISVSYNGTATATFTGPGGKSTPIPLLCKP